MWGKRIQIMIKILFSLSLLVMGLQVQAVSFNSKFLRNMQLHFKYISKDLSEMRKNFYAGLSESGDQMKLMGNQFVDQMNTLKNSAQIASKNLFDRSSIMPRITIHENDELYTVNVSIAGIQDSKVNFQRSILYINLYRSDLEDEEWNEHNDAVAQISFDFVDSKIKLHYKTAYEQSANNNPDVIYTSNINCDIELDANLKHINPQNVTMEYSSSSVMIQFSKIIENTD
jgi:HSP20 family molecular chaperone IbpA